LISSGNGRGMFSQPIKGNVPVDVELEGAALLALSR
jgi:hypothetical protein